MNYSHQFPIQPKKQRRPRSRKGVTQVKAIYTLVYTINDRVIEKIVTGTRGLCIVRQRELQGASQYASGKLEIVDKQN